MARQRWDYIDTWQWIKGGQELQQNMRKMTQQNPVPSYNGSYKWGQPMGQSHTGIHETETKVLTSWVHPHLRLVVSQWRQQIGWRNRNNHQFNGDITGKNRTLHPIQTDLNLHGDFMQGLSQCPTSLNLKCLFLAIIILMGHDIHESLKYHWLTTEQFFSPCYSKRLRWQISLYK
jgi:hypothetical protein